MTAWLAPVRRFLPRHRARILDLGAGSGVLTGWLADRGHGLWAVEPVAAFLRHGAARLPQARWIDDRLPALSRLAGGTTFDLIIASAVLHHLTPRDQHRALRRAAGLVAPGGRMILSLRHGPGARGLVHPVDPAALIVTGGRAGLRCRLRRPSGSLQAHNRVAGVRWTWLVLERARRVSGRP